MGRPYPVVRGSTRRGLEGEALCPREGVGMMDLDQIQRNMFEAVRQPLTASEDMRQRTREGRSLHGLAESIIKPNDRLTSLERLEIYNRQYWFRLLSCMYDDFPGLRAIVGEKQFEKLATAYLLE